jgi:hypothetical protein
MLTPTPWSLLFIIIIIILNFLLGQIDPMSLMTMSFFLPSSKGATTSFKPIYNYCWQQWGFFFHSSSKVPQLFSNLTNVVDNNEF